MTSMEEKDDALMDELLKQLDEVVPSEDEDEIEPLKDVHLDDETILILTHNGLGSNLKTLDAIVVFESELRERSAIVNVRWDLNSPREPESIFIEYLTGDYVHNKKRRIEAVRNFRENTAIGETYCQLECDVNFMKIRGYSQLRKPGGAEDLIYATLGRNGLSITSFLLGGNHHAETDLTYDNAWGGWA